MAFFKGGRRVLLQIVAQKRRQFSSESYDISIGAPSREADIANKFVLMRHLEKPPLRLNSYARASHNADPYPEQKILCSALQVKSATISGLSAAFSYHKTIKTKQQGVGCLRNLATFHFGGFQRYFYLHKAGKLGRMLLASELRTSLRNGSSTIDRGNPS